MERLPLRHDDPLVQQQQQQQQRERRVRWRRTLPRTFAVVVLLALAAFAFRRSPVSPSSPPVPMSPPAIAALERLVTDYAAQNLTASVRVSRDGVSQFAHAVGLASEELRVPLAVDTLFPIGSNSKLFVSVALYQLQERGRVNLSRAVNDYLTQRDFATFGYPNQTRWCPRLASAPPNAPCENVTFVDLLNMGSGIGDVVNCDNVAPQFCRRSANDLAVYRGSIGAHVGQFINDPLVFAPGSNFSYSNANYMLAAYLVEQLSGQALEVYLREHIFEKVGLTHTLYDPFSGLLAVQRGYADQYANYYVGMVDGEGRGVPSEFLGTGTCSPYVSSGAANGAGGLRSTTGDMNKWFSDLFGDRGQRSKVLREASVRAIVRRRNRWEPSYAQGVTVAFGEEDKGDDDDDAWPKVVAYCGGTKCAFTCMRMEPAAGVVGSAFTNHGEFYFASRAAFDAWRPTEFMFAAHEGLASAALPVLPLVSDAVETYIKLM